MTSTSADTLAGYRLIRKLGSGSRSEVYLGVSQPAQRVGEPVLKHPEGESRGTAGPSAVTAPVALKAFRADAAPADVANELGILGVVGSPHCVRLIDVGADGAGNVVAVLTRVGGGSLARLLHARGGISAGEAVTILAPLCLEVARLHRLGVAHLSLGPGSIHFGEVGEPVIIGFGHASRMGLSMTDAALDVHPAASADRVALSHLVRFVLEGTTGLTAPGGGPSPLEWIEAQGAPGAGFAHGLAERLFEMSPPAPVEFDAAPASAVVAYGRTGRPVPGVARRGVTAELSARPGQRVGPRWAEHFLGERPGAALLSRIRIVARTVRVRVWILTAVGAVALAAALVAIPALDGQEDGSPGDTAPAEPGSQPGSVSGGGAPGGLVADPVAALPQLLLQRERCFAERSVLCLDLVDHEGSSAWSDDREAIAALSPDGGAQSRPVEPPATLRLVERLGDSALISTGTQSEPASVLMIRTEAGWRIRDVLPG